MYAIDATYQGGMGRAVGGIFTADGDNESFSLRHTCIFETL